MVSAASGPSAASIQCGRSEFRSRLHRMAQRFPHGLPTGWFQVARTAELPRGRVLPLRYFGSDLVLFRTEQGVPHLLDAFCPHLGAHLGRGGKVVGERLVCPFHAWEFDGLGRCAAIPSSARQPPRVGVRCWPLAECNGQLFTWYDRAGREPTWTIPTVEELGAPGWSTPVLRDWHVRTTVQEMAENQVDGSHFRHLHGSPRSPRTVAEQHGHELRSRSRIASDTPVGLVEGQVEVISHGLGWATIRHVANLETLVIGGSTPIDEDHVHLRIAFTARVAEGPRARGVADAFLRGVDLQIEQDRPIWENKAYIEHPPLVEGERAIAVFRAWARQFYPEPAEP
ncbi:MAG: Rieske 2Fe-2S domain-containing protein [Ideonella sp.]|nr:Rieske 2Fe-2S domain-containing protein [Ideonella sp.]